MKIFFLSLFIMLYSVGAKASCKINNAEENHKDFLGLVLESSDFCPQDVQELKKILEKDGVQTYPAMVANRGHHNPKLGSFSIFESVSGPSQIMGLDIQPEHLYFGHFTTIGPNNEIVLDQKAVPNKLLIEAIAYDFEKSIYNFYELIGTTSGAQWFYRGNSHDAYADNKLLKLSSRPQFGTKMRCSGCHTSGGPIMKELATPHNDWWTAKRGLPFAPNKPSLDLKKYLVNIIDASSFSKNVLKGIELVGKSNIPSKLTLKEKLRPLFCTTEINLLSDVAPLESPSSVLEISSDIFVDPLLVKAVSLKMEKDFYLSSLQFFNSRFPENNQLDAAHGFLAPVKGHVNHLQVMQLMADGSIDEEFALDVLSIDFKNPLFSKERCQLLKLVPETGNWKAAFKQLLQQSLWPVALELAKKMEEVNGQQHRQEALAYLQEKQKNWASKQNVQEEVVKLNSLRISVFKDEISQNPRGQILEPGFRVIFPVLSL